MITISLTTILTYFVIAFVLTNMFKNVLFELKLKVKNTFLQFIITKLYCLKCFSFWMTLIFTLSITCAAFVAFTAIIFETINNIYNIIE